MQWLAQLSITRAVFATVLMLGVVVVGLAGYASLGVDAFPKVDFPTVSIITRLEGAAPEEVETQITDKIEAAVNTIAGIDELRSISSEGVSQVLVTFSLDRDINVAAQDVRDHISTAIPELPRGIDNPVVQKLDPDASPVLFIAVKHPSAAVRDITEIADKRVRRDIENISGVGQATLLGGRKRQLNVWLNLDALQGHGLTAADVQRAIVAQNLSAPGGAVQTGPRNITLRVMGRVASAEALGRLIVRQSADHPVRVADLATVEDGQEEEETAAALDGVPAVVLAIRKQSGENTVKVVELVRARLQSVAASLPAGYTVEVVRDSSLTIQTQVNAVKEHLVLGALFAALVVLVFLGNLRSTVIAALAIPISIIGTFALMAYQGFTLNIITLLALALAVGIVIDDAIVVLENIYRFIHEKKMKPFPAAVAATRDIGMAVMATTLSLLAVFLPVAFMGGIVGRFLHSFGLTMSFAIAVSLLVSFTLTPMLAARWLDPPSATLHRNRLERLVDAVYLPIERTYMVMLRWAMAHRLAIIGCCLLTLAAGVPLFKRVPKGFLPANDEGNFEINVRAPEGTSLRATSLIAERIARQTRAIPGVTHTLVTLGNNEQKTPNLANIYVKLVDPEARTETQQQLVAITRDKVVRAQPPELRIDVSDVAAFNSGNSSKTVQYIISGPDLGQLAAIAERVQARFKKVPGTVDVDMNLILGKPEVTIEVQRDKASSLGVQMADIANAVRLMVGGLQISTFEDAGEVYDIRMRARVEDRDSVARVGRLSVPSTQVGTVALSDMVDFIPRPGPSEINRINRRRQVLISANTLPGASEGAIIAELETIVADERLPSGFRGSASGRTRESGKAGKSFISAFGLSIVFMYLILAAQFESWIYPLSILVSLPLTVPFALLSLLIFGQGINIQSALGLLVLFGVVKKNAILQVDHTNSLRAAGMPRLEAILTANRDRLRPILMTTLAFVAGMAPLVTANGIGAGFNRATAGIVVGGQSLSLLLTLLATPVIYSYLDDAAGWYHRWRNRGGIVDRGAEAIGLNSVHH